MIVHFNYYVIWIFELLFIILEQFSITNDEIVYTFDRVYLSMINEFLLKLGGGGERVADKGNRYAQE